MCFGRKQVFLFGLLVLICAFAVGLAQAASSHSALNNALVQALQHNNISRIKLLVHKGADPNCIAGEKTVLIDAVSRNDIRLVHLLLNKGANANLQSKQGITPLMAAAYAGNVAIGEMLLQHGADLNTAEPTGHFTALHIAADAQHTAFMKLLLEKKADTESRDVIGRTPLLRAAAFGNLPAFSVLLKHGADVNAKEELGYTALMITNRADIAKLLVEKGAKLEARSALTGGTPLTAQSASGNTQIVRLLLDKGAKTDEGDMNGRTALMQAAIIGKPDLVHLLLARGANANIKDKKGNTALTYAKRDKDTEIAELLTNAGASE